MTNSRSTNLVALMHIAALTLDSWIYLLHLHIVVYLPVFANGDRLTSRLGFFGVLHKNEGFFGLLHKNEGVHACCCFVGNRCTSHIRETPLKVLR